MSPEDRRKLDALTKKLADEGKLLEAGFAALRHAVVPADAPESQVRDMRLAYMAGAQHLFASVLSVLEPGSEPTEADLRRMTLLSAELDQFSRELLLLSSSKG